MGNRNVMVPILAVPDHDDAQFGLLLGLHGSKACPNRESMSSSLKFVPQPESSLHFPLISCGEKNKIWLRTGIMKSRLIFPVTSKSNSDRCTCGLSTSDSNIVRSKTKSLSKYSDFDLFPKTFLLQLLLFICLENYVRVSTTVSIFYL